MAFRNAAAAVLLGIAAVAGGLTAAQAAPVQVVALGDSLTAGYGLAPDAGFVPQLQAWLTAQGREVVIANAGVSGDTSAGGLSRLDWSLAPGTQALIVILGGNDMLRGLPVDETRRNLAAILDGAKARGLPVLLVPMVAPGNYGPDYKADFDAIYPELAAEKGAQLAPAFFAPLLQAAGGDPAGVGRWMQADGLHPNPEGVALIVQGLGPSVLELLDAAK